MADISPFHGIRFNPEKINDLSQVVTPPYDVIPEDMQKAYYDRHPNNVIRLDKNMPARSDTPENNSHTRAAGYFRKWIDDGILVQDNESSFYATSVRFEINEKPITRMGLIAAVRLEEFSAGIILPHEETFSKVKSERLGLMKACHANFSHIFSVYSDQGTVSGMLASTVERLAPIQAFSDDAGHDHRVWKISDRETNNEIIKALKDQRLFIADGHHRYETALNYRQWIKDNDSNFDDNHPANFIMMYLCAVEDPGLTILPTHRLISGISENGRARLIKDAHPYFDVEKIALSSDDPAGALRTLREKMNANREVNVIGLIIKNHPDYYLLRLKPGVMKTVFGKEIPEPLRGLDVTVLTHLVLMKLVGFDKKDLDDESLIRYKSRDEDAAQHVLAGNSDIAFMLNPPSNDQVRLIAEAGYTMPRKTTYYYPKVITGQVMKRLDR